MVLFIFDIVLPQEGKTGNIIVYSVLLITSAYVSRGDH